MRSLCAQDRIACGDPERTGLPAAILILLRGAYPKAPAPAALRSLHFSALANKFAPLQNAKTPTIVGAFVPRKGFEPSHPFGRCDLNTVRLPISPPGHHLIG